MGSGVIFDPSQMERVIIFSTEAKVTLGSNLTPNPFSVSFPTTISRVKTADYDYDSLSPCPLSSQQKVMITSHITVNVTK